MHQIHELKPVYFKDSEILILGSFPSEKSRETGFYYGHKNNRFWPLMSSLFNVELKTVEEKISFLRQNHIALFDVIAECEIDLSSDSSIRNAVANDIPGIIAETGIRKIYINGAKAFELFEKFFKGRISVPYVKLPSTSSANASFSFERLKERWSEIRGA